MKSSESPGARQETIPAGTAGSQADIGRRRPTIPSGIVTTRLGQLKTRTDENGSIIRYNHGNKSRWGSANGGFVIPASRSTVFLHATPPRSLDKMSSPLGVDRLLMKKRTGPLKFILGPRISKSYDVLSSHAAAATELPNQPFHETMPEQILHDEEATQPKAAYVYANYWANGDGVRDDSSGAHVCHSCGEWISFQEPCGSCGHAFCSRCTADVEEDSNTSPIPTGNSEAPSSSTAPQQPSDQSDEQGNNYDAENYPWSNESRNQTTSMSSSTRSVPRAKTLSSLFLNQPARHCICCIARQPIRRRQTVAAMPGAHTKVYSSSYSGSSTATHATVVSNPRLPEDLIPEEDLRPAALQPRRSTEAKHAIPLKTTSSDPYIGRRLLRPHPHQPSPEIEDWPKLRQVPVSSNARPNVESDERPWGRDALRKVSKPAIGEPEVYQKPVPKPEWVANLKKVRGQSAQPMSPNEERWQPQTPRSPLDRSEQDRVYCDRNRSVSARPSERPASSIYDEPLPQCEHNRPLPKSPSLASRTSRGSLKQVESSFIKNNYVPETNNLERREQHRPPDAATLNRPRSTTLPPKDGRLPSIMKAPARGKSRDPHSCHWRDRFMDLSAEVDQLRSELDSCEPGETNSPHMEREHECDDAGIDGLTVVIHLKGRDDLVINTDLRTT